MITYLHKIYRTLAESLVFNLTCLAKIKFGIIYKQVSLLLICNQAARTIHG